MESYILTSIYREPPLSLLAPSRLSPTHGTKRCFLIFQNRKIKVAKMLNWGMIDNDKVFQRLINHLFALECNSPGFIPSSPYIGADGAWDGYYNGYYPYEKRSGIWSIQSKWTTRSFKEAFSSLSTEVKKELKNADAVHTRGSGIGNSVLA
jgi:hypothetical protein